MLLLTLSAKRLTLADPLDQQFAEVSLTSFENLAADRGALQVLTVLDDPDGPEFQITPLGQKPQQWSKPKSLGKDVPGFTEFVAESPLGPALLWMRMPHEVSFTYATYFLPGRATLFTVTRGKKQQLLVRQYMLPLANLMKHHPDEVKTVWETHSKIMLPLIYIAQERFREKRRVGPTRPSEGHELWDFLLSHPWIDPLTSLISAYELIREGLTGDEGEKRRGVLANLIKKLRSTSTGAAMADLEAIARSTKEPSALPSSPPLFTDGVLAFTEAEEGPFMWGLKPAHIDYASTCTSWRGEIPRP
jgi:hypothetical protein